MRAVGHDEPTRHLAHAQLANELRIVEAERDAADRLLDELLQINDRLSMLVPLTREEHRTVDDVRRHLRETGF